MGAAAPKTPEVLLSQLKPGGRLICPVGPQYGAQYLEQVCLRFKHLNQNEKLIQLSFSSHPLQYDKDERGEVSRTKLMSVVYVPLTDLNGSTVR